MLFEKIIEIIDPEPHAAALNMALDEALLQHATEPILRIYGWRKPAVSFGYFGKYAEASRTAAGREIVRRWTGGGLVEHGADVTYTLIVPRAAEFFQQSALESYRVVHEVLAHWLAGRGVAAHVAPGDADGKSSACFAKHVRYDLVAGEAKVAGAAQRRTRWGLLHQGSIQVPISSRPPQESKDLGQAFARNVLQDQITPTLLHAAERIAQDKYASDAWLRKF